MLKSIKSATRNILGYFGYKITKNKDYRKLAFVNELDPKMVELIELVQKNTMTSPERLNSLIDAVRYIVENNIEGSIVECGVWKGGSMMAVAYTLKDLLDIHRELYLFDTYEGMPPPTEKDVTRSNIDAHTLLNSDNSSVKEAHFCYSSLEEVQENLKLTNYPFEQVYFVKGKVEDTIPKQAPENIALLRLDTDWYESTKHELEHLFPRLVPGGVIIIDDYGYWKGCKEATDEYLSNYKIPLLLNRIDATGRIGIKWQS